MKSVDFPSLFFGESTATPTFLVAMQVRGDLPLLLPNADMFRPSFARRSESNPQLLGWRSCGGRQLGTRKLRVMTP